MLRALLLAALALGGAASPAAALEVPPLTGRVVDAAHLLPADLAASLSAGLAAHEARTGNQVALLTLPSLEGEPLEEFSHRVATTWKLGQKGTDNGVLILVVPGDRKVRIEVGYGLEGTLTDAKSSRIIREEMTTRFSTGDFAGGITAGVKAVLGTIEGTYSPPERKTVQGGKTSALNIFYLAVVVGILTAAFIGRHWKGGSIGGAMAFMLGLSSGWLLAIAAAVIVLIVTLVLAGLSGGGGRSSSPGLGGGWGGGSFGGFSGGGGFGGGFSGGGGSFGGGGASGNW